MKNIQKINREEKQVRHRKIPEGRKVPVVPVKVSKPIPSLKWEIRKCEPDVSPHPIPIAEKSQPEIKSPKVTDARSFSLVGLVLVVMGVCSVLSMLPEGFVQIVEGKTSETSENLSETATHMIADVSQTIFSRVDSGLSMSAGLGDILSSIGSFMAGMRDMAFLSIGDLFRDLRTVPGFGGTGTNIVDGSDSTEHIYYPYFISPDQGVYSGPGGTSAGGGPGTPGAGGIVTPYDDTLLARRIAALEDDFVTLEDRVSGMTYGQYYLPIGGQTGGQAGGPTAMSQEALTAFIGAQIGNAFRNTVTTGTVLNGGTGVFTAPGLGEILVGNGSGGYSLVPSSSLGSGGGGSAITTSMTNNFIPRWADPEFVNSIIYDDGNSIGIGTSTPNATLDIVQTVNGLPIISARRNTDIVPSGDFISYVGADGTSLFRVDNSGNVFANGAGTSGAQTVTATSSPQFRVQYDSLNEMTVAVTSTGSTTIGMNGTTPSLTFTPQLNSVNSFSVTNAASIPVLSIDTLNNRVGIGTTSPTTLLALAGTTTAQNIVPAGPYTNNLSPYNLGISNQRWNQIWVGNVNIGTSTWSIAPDTAGSLGFYDQPNGGGNQRVTITNSGFVGIGTTSPSQSFSVQGNSLFSGNITAGNINATGTVSFGGTTAFSSTATTTFAGGLNSAGTINAQAFTINGVPFTGGASLTGTTGQIAYFSGTNTAVGTSSIFLATSGNVGIGVTAPAAKLQVHTADASASGLLITTANSGAVATDGFFVSLDSSNVAYLLNRENGPMTFSTNNTEKMRINANGNVGIGTTNPTAATLVVQSTGASIINVTNSTADSNPNIGIQNDARLYQLQTVGARSDNFEVWDGTASATRLAITSTGNVGIGTTIPTSKLQVTGEVYIDTYGSYKVATGNGKGRMTGIYNDDGSSNHDYLILSDNYDYIGNTIDSGFLGTAGIQLIATNGGAGNIRFDIGAQNVAPTTRMIVSGSGNVGIGTTAPDDNDTGAGGSAGISKLYVSDQTSGVHTKIIVDGPLNGGSWVEFALAGTQYGDFGIDANQLAFLSRKSNSYISWWTNGGSITEKMRLSASGNLGIGTTNPQARLTVKDSGFRGGINFERAGTTVQRDSMYIGDGTNGTLTDEFYQDALNTGIHFRTGVSGLTEAFTIMVGGNVGITNTNPLAKLSFAQGGINPWNVASGGVQITNTAGNPVAGFINNVGGDYGLFNVLRPGGIVDAGDFQFYTLGPASTPSGLFRASSVLMGSRSDFTAGLTILAEAGSMRFATGGFANVNERMVITNAGNVGIGTTTPGSLLSVGTTNGINLSTATSTFSSTGGISLAAGCFAINGVCVSGGGATLTGTTGQVAYFSGTNTAVGTSSLFIATSGKVGVGTSSPAAVLHLGAGSAAANNAPLKFTSGPVLGTTEAGTMEYDGTHLYFTAANAGTRFQLDQQAGTGAVATDVIWDAAGDLVQGTGANTAARLPLGTAGQILRVNPGATAVEWGAATAGTSQWVDGSSSSISYSLGRVGIGVTTLGSKLHVVDTTHAFGLVEFIMGGNTIDDNWGALAVSDSTVANGRGGAITLGVGDINGGFQPFAGIKGKREGADFGGMGLFTRPSGGTATDRLHILGSGNVGIGTLVPTSLFSVGSSNQFQVNSTGNIVKLNNLTTSFPSVQGVANSFLRNDGAGNLTWADPAGTGVSGFWQRTGTNLAPANIGDNVGIGTAAPNYLLEVNKSANAATDLAVINANAGAAATSRFFLGEDVNAGKVIAFQYFNSGYTPSGLLLQNQGWMLSSSGATNGIGIATLTTAPIVFATGGVLAANERMRITSAGLIGIGTTSPVTTFDVNGTISVANGVGPSLTSVSADRYPTLGFNAYGSSYTAGVGGFGGVFQLDNTTGQLIYYTGPNAARGVGRALTSALAINNNGNVGIATAAPLSKLGVLGNASIGATYGAVAAPTSGLIVEGNVGIGTTTPGSLLSVGTTNGINLSTATSTFSSTGGINLAAGCFALRGVCVGGASGAIPTGTTGQISYFNGTNTQIGTSSIFITSTGAVGIGTVTPVTRFHVNLDTGQLAHFGGTLGGITNGLYSGISIGYSDVGPTYQKSAIVQTQTGDGAARGTILFLNNNAATNANATLADARMAITAAGNVGVGTTSPSGKLSIKGTGTGTGDALLITDSNDIERMVIQDDGSVGIGTSAPNAKLEILDANKAFSTNVANLQIRTSDTATINMGGSIGFLGNYTGTSQVGFALIKGAKENSTAGNYAGYLAFTTLPNGGNHTERMRITSTGNVGIATAVPLSTLGVLGNVSIGATYGAIAAPTSGLIVEGNVGIGTASPSSLLDVFSNTDPILAITKNGGTGIINFRANTHIQQIQAQIATPDDGAFSAHMTFSTKGQSNAGVLTEKMRLTSLGNLGIGTVTAPQRLTVEGNGLFAGTVTATNITATGTVTFANLTGTGNVAFTGCFTVDTTTFFVDCTNDRVGVGTITPASLLDVFSNTDPILSLTKNGGNQAINFRANTHIQKIQAQIAGVDDANFSDHIVFSTKDQSNAGVLNERMRLTSTGSLGIGISPTEKLHVVGNGLFSGNVTAANITATGNLTLVNLTSSGNGTFAGCLSADSPTFVVSCTTDRVGIGTATPGALLSLVKSDTNAVGITAAQTAVVRVINTGATAGEFSGIQFAVADTNAQVLGAIGTVMTDGSFQGAGDMVFGGKQGHDDTGLTEYMRIRSGGNVGIATTSPSQKLSVQGNALVSGNIIGTNVTATGVLTFGTLVGTGDVAFTGCLSADSPTFVLDCTNNRVGIGTATPGRPLSVVKSDTSATGLDSAQTAVIRVVNNGGVAGGFSGIQFGNLNDSNAQVLASIGAVASDYSFQIAGDMVFGTKAGHDDVSVVENMRLKAGGNFGIATTSPSQRLSVQGNALVSGNITATNITSTGVLTFASLVGTGNVTFPACLTVDTTTFFVDCTNDRVGIGTITPGRLLTLLKSDASVTGMDAAQTAVTRIVNTNTALGTFAGIQFGYGDSNTGTLASIGSVMADGAQQGAGDLLFGLKQDHDSTGLTEYMRMKFGGNLGIGTTSPSQKLSVQGSGLFSGNITATNMTSTGVLTFTTLAGTGNVIFGGCFSADSPTFVVDCTNDRVGIGTASPARPLVIVKSDTSVTGMDAAQTAVVRVINTGATVGEFAGIQFGYGDSNTGTLGSIGTVLSDGSFQGAGDLVFGTKQDHDATNLVERMRIAFGGNVGIGTAAPTSRFSVGASSQFQVNSTGNIIKLNNVTTSFPSAQGAANSFLRNDGAGNLTWADPASTGVAGFWQRTGTTLAPTTITDSVGIGIATAASLLHLSSTAPIVILDRTGAGTTGAYLDFRLAGVTKALYGMAGTTDSLIAGTVAGDFALRTASQKIFFSTDAGTTAHMVISGSNVGIGTTNPNSILNVAKTSAGAETTGLSLSNLSDTANTAIGINFQMHSTGVTLAKIVAVRTAASNAPSDLAFSTYNDGISPTGLNERMRITSSGSVGIGTANPSSRLELFAGDFTIRASTSSPEDAGDILFTHNSGAQKARIFSLPTVGTSLMMNGDGSTVPALTINGSANVGIGTTSPLGKLQISVDETGTGNAGNYAQLEITGQSNALKRLSIGYNTTSNLGFIQASTDGSTFDILGLNPLGGNVGVGLIAPVAKLQVHTTDGSSSGLLVTTVNSGAAATDGFFLALDSSNIAYLLQRENAAMTFSTNGTEEMRIMPGGNVGIGDTNPGQNLTVAGTVGLPGIATAAGTAYVCTTIATGVLSESATACNPSSIRFKDNVQPLAYGLSDVMNLNAVSFTYKPDMLITGNQVGFLAEDMAEVIPEIVGFDSEGLPNNIDYGKLTPVLTKAIQEQQREITDLKAAQLANTLTVSSTTSATSDASLTIFDLVGLTTEQGNRITAIQTELALLASRVDALASSTSNLSVEFFSLKATVATLQSNANNTNTNYPTFALATSTMDLIASSTASQLASSTPFIQNIADAIGNMTARRDNPLASGITISDRATGQPVCMYVSNGVMQAEPGECGKVLPTTGTPSPSPNQTPATPQATTTEPNTAPPSLPSPTTEPVNTPTTEGPATVTPQGPNPTVPPPIPDPVTAPVGEATSGATSQAAPGPVAAE